MRNKIKKMCILKPERKTGMNVIVCTKNRQLKRVLYEKEADTIFFSDDLDVEIKEFDLAIVDLNLCSGKLDVAKMQSNRTIYVLMDITEENINKLLYEFRGEHPFSYKVSGKEYTVDLNDIVYFESRHKIVRGYNDAGEFIRFYNKLDEVQKKVNDFVLFLRINKSYLVNFNYCTIEKDRVMVLGKEIQISRKYKNELKKRLEIIKNM